MAKVEIYISAFCPYCDRAKRLLQNKGVDYEEHQLDDLSDDDLHKLMMELSGQQTVPQIVINGKPIGGWDELSALGRTGELDVLLQESP